MLDDPLATSLRLDAESCKVKMARIEAILLNFSGVYRDADGVLNFSIKSVPVPEMPTPVAEQPATEPETEKEPEVG